MNLFFVKNFGEIKQSRCRLVVKARLEWSTTTSWNILEITVVTNLVNVCLWI